MLKCLTIVDDATTEAVAIVPARALGGLPVTRVLDHLAATRGLPLVLRVDYGPEFCGRALLTWAHERGLTLRLIEPGKPNQNAYVESFNGRLPRAIRTDNGVPFASAHALYGLSKLSVWWLRLGIQIERIRPGHPEQNGRHDRMHLTRKTEATKPAAADTLQQQARFDTFLERFNHERPHQALGMKVPGAL